MKERIEEFRNALMKKNHIMQLAQDLNLCLKFETEYGIFFFHIQKNMINLTETFSSLADQHISLIGSEENLRYLLDGKIKLRDAIQLGYVKLECPFRTLLALESILYLARPLPEEIFI